MAFRFPLPLTDGYRLRVYNYCKCLKNIGYNIDLFFIYEKEYEYKEFLEKKEIKDIFDKIIPIKLTKIQKIKNLLKSMLKQESLQENIYITPSGKDYLKDNSDEYEKLFISYIRMYKYVDKIEGYKVLDYTDSLAYHYDRARYKAKGLWRLIYNYEFSKIKKLEKDVLKKVNKAMITSNIDRNYILEEKVDKKIGVFSQAIDEKLFNYKRTEKNNNLVFIGKLDYYPNEDAVLYFINEVFPYIQNYKLQIIGVNPTEKIKKIIKNKQNIELLGYLEDPYQVIKNAKLMIAPIRIGGGIQNKILEDTWRPQTIILDTPYHDVQEIKITITDIYRGLKYNDLCISEISFWGSSTDLISNVVFKGNIDDKYPIVMTLQIEGSSVKGKYYYTKYDSSNSLKLVGTYSNKILNLNEYNSDNENTGVFNGRYEENIFSGIFINYKGKQMPFKLYLC